MARTTRYREQHDELEGIVRQMLGQLEPARLASDSTSMRQQLARLAGKLKMHLNLEDNCLYPDLIKHSDAQVRDLAQRYQKEMSRISKTFTDYVGKWPTAQTIQENPAGFIRETKEVSKVLDDRIRRENTELYRLADAAK